MPHPKVRERAFSYFKVTFNFFIVDEEWKRGMRNPRESPVMCPFQNAPIAVRAPNRVCLFESDFFIHDVNAVKLAFELDKWNSFFLLHETA